jgi:endonuclease/exonuclease/phosphatase (EEP) superfamily protein YafD
MGDGEAAAPDAAASASSQGRSVASRIAFWAGAVAIAALAVPVIARLGGLESGPLVYLVALMPWVTLACVVPVVLAAVSRSRFLFVVSLVTLGICLAWMVPLYVAQGDSSGSASVLRVATVNLTMGRGDAQTVVRLVEDRSIDILSVQELTPESVSALQLAGLDRLLPHREVRAEPGVTGTGLWSRYPLTAARPVPGFVSNLIRAELVTGDVSLTLFAVHPAAPGALNHDRWEQDMARLTAVLAETRGGVLVAGDFNTTRDHQVFRGLEDLGYVDAADQAGAGFQPTFPNARGPLPLVAIDHVIVRDPHLRATAVVTASVPGSDHLGLVATYVRT